jgi:hypothetical protein
MSPLLQDFDNDIVKGYWFLRSLGLANTDYLMDYGPRDTDLFLLEVDVLPLQSK